MEAFLVSTGIVALGEMGDKTQLLAVLLAARFRRPLPIIGGILVATLANHALAGAAGQWVANALGPFWLRWIIGVSFIAMAGWMLIPDRIDDDAAPSQALRLGVFGTTVVAFFLAEMGDKTQIATVALAARYDALVAVVTGTTLGMMLANVPAVYFGEAVARRVSMRWVHGVSALIFLLLGVLTLLNPAQLL
ncbi:MAG: putative Ca2+/H+ antiporter (TMEM165/GDT1 family) [Hydrogenophaga sp.]|jgi:putative Ca2+/H+ antiporter (TMEM165/GDT1 family)